MDNINQYFPERFVNNRERIKNAIKLFQNIDFEYNVNSFRDLSDYIRNPVEEWHEGAYLPDKLLDERDEILKRLRKQDYDLSEDPSKEEIDKWVQHQSIKMETQEWKEWSDWLERASSIIKKHPRLEEETITSRAIIDFWKNGRNIFHLSPFLTTLLQKTDVGNVRFEDIKLPYKSIYLHFGNVDSIEFPVDHIEQKHRLNHLDKKYYLDGAFVTESLNQSLQIVLTFIDKEDNFNKNISINTDFRFPTVEFTLDFGEVKEGITFNDSTVCFFDTWESDGDPSEIKYSKMHKLLKKPYDFEFESEFEEYDLFDRSLSLIVNSLCYLNYVDDDIEIYTTDKQSTQLLKELNQSNKKSNKEKLKRDLSRYSYSKIHLFGSKVHSEYRVTENGIELDSHWRRGHWRNQPFGHKFQCRKLIWIQPTIVSTDKGDPKQGHLYSE